MAEEATMRERQYRIENYARLVAERDAALDHLGIVANDLRREQDAAHSARVRLRAAETALHEIADDANIFGYKAWTIANEALARQAVTEKPHKVVDLMAALEASLEAAHLNTECSLCHVPLSTGPCGHLIEFGDGRVGMKRTEWESLVADRLRLRELTREDEQ